MKSIEWADKSSDIEAFIDIQYLSGKINGNEVFEINLDPSKSNNYKLFFLNKNNLIFEHSDLCEIQDYAELFFKKWIDKITKITKKS